MAMKLHTLGLSCVAGALIACGISAFAAVPLGKNFAGETCRLADAASISRPAEIICGNTAASSGALRMSMSAAAPSGPERTQLEAITHAALAVRSGQKQGISCEAGQWLGPPGDAVLILCTLTANAWPTLIVATQGNNVLYAAEGPPSMFPVLVTAVAQASGRRMGDDVVTSGRKLLEAKLSPMLLTAASESLASYKQFVEIGRLEGGSGDYAAAERAYRQALDIETNLFGPNSAPVGETLGELALQVSNQGRFEESAALFQRATPILEGSANPSLRARLASYLALDAANQRRYEDALKFARDATAARRAEIESASAGNPDAALAAPVSRGELAHSLRIEAEMALRLGDLASARAAAEESMWIITDEPGLPLWWRPDTLSLVGKINERAGRVVPAEHNFVDARDLNKKLFGDTAPTAMAELRLGAFYSGQQLYEPALVAYRHGVEILSKDPIARSHLVADQIIPFITAATAQAESSAALDAEILHISQLVQGNLTDQMIARMAARQAAGNPELARLVGDTQEAQRVRDALRINLAAESAKADEDRDPALEEKLKLGLKVASDHADVLAANLAKAFPDYIRLADPEPAKLSAVKAQLRQGEAFVSFIVGVNGGYALLVTRDGFKARKLDISSDDLAAEVAALRSAFTPVLGRLPPFSLKSSHALYQKLIGPLEADLAGIRHLIVASSGSLANLPFSLLVSEAPRSGDETDYKNAAWIVRRMALSEVPSARTFMALRVAEQTRVRAREPFLGMAAPTFVGERRTKSFALASLAGACLDGGPVAAATLQALPPLPETAGELNSVSRSLGAGANALLLGGGATEAALRARSLGNYAVLYFATHGLLPGELHCQSEPALALSPPQGSARSTQTDGMLTSSEIAALRLNADLVVLSACNTASGGDGKLGGGSLAGLASAFFNAGARAVLASHWQVSSASTVELMTGVFARRAADSSIGLAEALRQSQLALIDRSQSAHPFNWAAFTLIGIGDTQEQKQMLVEGFPKVER